MRANQEIREYTCTLTALLAISAPRPAGQKVGLSAQRFDPDLQLIQEFVALLVAGKMNAEFRVDQIANSQRSGIRGLLQGVRRTLIKRRVRRQNVQQYIGVDRRDHKLAAANVFHEPVDRPSTNSALGSALRGCVT